MNDLTDQQLLRDYAERQSEAAFAAIVQRYVDLVYSAAFRMVCDAHAAEDVTQSVFMALAQNAQQLTDRPALAGWLHGTARNLAAKTVRSEVRRRAREQEAAVMNELLSANPDASWEHIAPHLDDALGELSEPDRDAVLLRYFKNHDLRTVGATLGISDDAAQKRVSRAVDRLREFFAKRGVTVGASGLAVVISANAVQAAPVGLAVTISTAAALVGTTITTTATATVIKTIAMTTLQKTLITTTIAVLAGGGIYEARQASQLREQVQTLQQQQAPLAEQNRQLSSERDKAANRLAALTDENERLNRNTTELLRLRAEIVRLKNNARNLEQNQDDDTQAQWAAWVHAVRTNGINALADVPYLVQALTNQATPIRVEATKALRQIGLERLLNTNLTAQANMELELAAKVATPKLVEALNDSDAFVRGNAAITLGFLRENSQVVVPALINLLSDEQVRVAGSAAKALGRFQNDASSAIPELLQLAKSSNEDLRETAIAAIKQIDPKAAKTAGFD